MEGPFIIQSHRGAGCLAAENTRKAFELAWSLGTYPEADIRTTRDGLLVAFHDREVTPAGSEVPRSVRDLTRAELERAAGVEVPLLAEVLAEMAERPERCLYLDVKDADLDTLADLVAAPGMERRVILASPDPEVLRYWRRRFPNGETLHWMGGEEPALEARLAALRAAEFAGITQLQVHVRRGESGELRPSEGFITALAAELRARGILFQALPWHLSDPDVYRRLLQLGVRSFATDYPDVVAALLLPSGARSSS